MALFISIILSLWLYPIFAVVISGKAIGKRLLFISLSSAAVIIAGIITGLSTRWDEFDCFLIFTLYFSLLMLLLYFYSFKNKVIKVIAGLLVFFSLIVGYILGSVGVLGLAAIVSGFKPARTIDLGDAYMYKQFSLGMAPESYRGTKISILKRPVWLPGLEYEIFTKTYDREYFSDKYIPNNTSAYPTLYSDDFEVEFQPSNNRVILMDSVRQDTITLK